MTPWPLLVSLWAAGTSSTSTVAPVLRPPLGLPAVPFTVEADRLYSDDGVYVAEGNAILRRAGAVMFADRIRFDEASGTAIAEGGVTAIEDGAVLSCDRVVMKVPELIGGLDQAELRIKSEIPEPLLSRLSTAQLRRAGKDEMIVTADHMERTSPRTLEVRGGSFTVCDCGEGSTPSWRIAAQSADVDLDSGAWMYWPVFYAKGVPIFVLPVFYFPLGERRSGLLTPRPSFSPVAGFSVRQPLYLVLGEHADLTLDASYLSERGPGAGLELRWAPTVDSAGELHTALILDFGVSNGTNFDKDFHMSPIPRYSIALKHHTQIDTHAELAVDLNMLGDPGYLEFANEYLARQTEGTRSRLTIASFIQSNLRVAGGFQLFQDLRSLAYPGQELRRVQLFSGTLTDTTPLLGPGAVRYRFAELRLDAPPYPLVEGVPLLAEAIARVHAFSAPRPEVARFLRADLRPALSLPISLLGIAILEPSIAARITAWTGRFESQGLDANRFAFIAKASLFSTLQRDYGSVIHRVRPEVTYLLIPKVWGTVADPLVANDEVDQLASVMQVRARLLNDFILPTGARIGGFDLWWGRDLAIPWEDGDGRGNSEVVAKADAPLTPSAWPVHLGATARLAIDPNDASVDELAAGLTMTSQYLALGASYEQYGDEVPTYAFVAPEELVPAGTIDTGVYLPLDDWAALPAEERFLSKPWQDAHALNASIRITPIAALSLGFDIGLTFADDASSPVRDTRSSVRWVSPCQCWSADLIVTTGRDRRGPPGIQFALDLSRLGGGF